MTTQADVINAALLECEQPEATGPNDTAIWVRRVRNRYAAVVRALLERHPWDFATKRQQLTALEETPIGRTYAYNKPGDCLRILQINSTGNIDDNDVPDYEDEGGRILADMSPCFMRFISSDWIVNEGAWPQVFADAVAMDLAAKCYVIFGKSASKKDEIRRTAKSVLQMAKSWDAQQKPHRALPRGRWASVRAGSGVPRSIPSE